MLFGFTIVPCILISDCVFGIAIISFLGLLIVQCILLSVFFGFTKSSIYFAKWLCFLDLLIVPCILLSDCVSWVYYSSAYFGKSLWFAFCLKKLETILVRVTSHNINSAHKALSKKHLSKYEFLVICKNCFAKKTIE